jgi:hypothetical protein
MKKFEVIEIEYDQLREDLKSNCEDMIDKNNIMFNFNEEEDQYIAYVKFDPYRARSLEPKPRYSSPHTRVLRRKKKNFVSNKYGIFNDYPFKPRSIREKSEESTKILIKSSKSPPKKKRKPKIKEPTKETQGVFHESCLKEEIKSRSKYSRVKGTVMYKPTSRGRSADLARRINNLPGEGGRSKVSKKVKFSRDNRGYKQTGKIFVTFRI